MKTTRVLVYVFYAGLVCALNVERTGQEAEEKIFGKQDDANPTHQRSRQFFRYILRVVEVLDHVSNLRGLLDQRYTTVIL